MNILSPDQLISVVVSTYNRPEALKLVLRGLVRQDDEKFEVIVAEDGRDPRTRAVIDAIRKEAPALRFEHCCQEHKGFRLAALRNKGCKASKGVYLIYLDGDCVPPPDFVSTHRRLATVGCCVLGQRILSSKALAETLEKMDSKDPIDWSLSRFALLRLRGGINRLTPRLALMPSFVREGVKCRLKQVKGCNFALWKVDYERVNGSDESFVGWGSEDKDLALRLMKSGVNLMSGHFASWVLHLWHMPSSRASAKGNEERLLVREKDLGYRAKNGLYQDGEGHA